MSALEKSQLFLIGSVLLGLSLPGLVWSEEFGTTVPHGAESGDLFLQPCQIHLPGDDRSYPGDCGTLVVPEYRKKINSRLIALPDHRAQIQNHQQ